MIEYTVIIIISPFRSVLLIIGLQKIPLYATCFQQLPVALVRSSVYLVNVQHTSKVSETKKLFYNKKNCYVFPSPLILPVCVFT